MSEFSILYRSLHCEQKAAKKADKNESSELSALSLLPKLKTNSFWQLFPL